MSRLLLIVLLFFLLYYIVKLFLKDISSFKRKTDPNEPEELVKDPNCEIYIPKSTALKKKVNGRIQHFCSERCFKNYLENLKDLKT